MSEDISKKLVDAILADTPDHKPGTRPVHAVGIAAEGSFAPLKIARKYCVAEHFSRAETPVTVRFSNGTGSPVQHDAWSDVRGMATRFHLDGGKAADLIAMTLGEFFAPTIESFLEFTKAAYPKPGKAPGPWRKLLDMLRLKPPAAPAAPGQPAMDQSKLIAYANRHAFSRIAITDLASIGAPASFVRATYHAVNTFIAVGSDGRRRPVRFLWQPVSGVRRIDFSRPLPDDYLHRDLKERLARWPARFILNMVIGEANDDIADPTRPWPRHRTKVTMGTLTLRNLAADQEAAAERIAFNPCRLPPGLELSEDPILQARRGAYEYSRELRGGSPCPFFGEG